MILFDVIKDLKKTEHMKSFNENDREYIDKAIAIITTRVGDFVKNCRAEQDNMSIRELSERSAVSNAVISELECYKSLPKIDVLIRLMYGLHIPFKALFDRCWDMQASQEWEKLCGRKLQSEEDKHERYIIGEKTIKVSSDIKVSNIELLSLNKILAHEGLSTVDIKDVLDYIEYKKFKRKNK